MKTTRIEDDAENGIDPLSLMIKELKVNDSEDLQDLINYTEYAQIESDWTRG